MNTSYKLETVIKLDLATFILLSDSPNEPNMVIFHETGITTVKHIFDKIINIDLA